MLSFICEIIVNVVLSEVGTNVNKNKRPPITIHINNIKIKESQEVILLGHAIDNQLTFKEHIDNCHGSASYNLYYLHRIRKYLTFDKAKLLCSAFANSQCNYASVI